MLKATFIHDHNFVYDSKTGCFYDGSGGAFDGDLWGRYLEVFDDLIVIGRQIDKLPNRLVLASHDRVEFSLVKGAHGFINTIRNQNRIKSEIKSTLSTVDFAIIRIPSTLGKWAIEICKKNRIPYLLEVVGDPFEAYWFHGSVLGKLIAPVQSFSMKKQVANAKNVIYVTKNHLQRKYPTSQFTTAISNVRLTDTIDVSTLKNFYLTAKKPLVIGMIGTFHVKYKGHIEAIKALSILKRKGITNVVLQLVGSGDSQWVADLALKYGVNNNVKFLGVLPSGNEGVIPFLDHLDLYIHPSLTEGLPRVVIEAMSRGRVCLVSNAGGTDELINKEYIHDVRDSNKLAADIEKIYNLSGADRLEIGLENLKTSKGYLENVLQKKRVDFINQVLSRK